ncbi:hypothetical protein GCM10010399_29990 [Dactylosporangium fulvum]|uniref:Uncharacterized protein n=1 Tax=Dactylosporangium fulvum TaxID=53359 RepID=A0ABY5W3D2_9ACTN|nr:hypothetical protein [Dactylosporangium fulvum]UWP83855.1 hypothetical protein Dfulv_06240 [Dactylosporangium fulvum]
MDKDPSNNLVAFRLRQDEHPAVGRGRTRDDDAVRQAWREVQRSHGATGVDVVELYSEWEPSAADLAFIEDEFPSARLTYSFSRPETGDWDAALAEAHRAMASAEFDRNVRHAESNGELLPVLWSLSAPNGAMANALPFQEVVPGRLVVALAMVAMTERGTIGMSHVMERDGFGDRLAESFGNLTRGLRVDALDNGMLALRREGMFVSSAVALPDFPQRMMQLLETDRIVVAIPDPDNLLVAAAGSPPAAAFGRIVRESPVQPSELVPTLLEADRSGLRVVDERP